MNTNTAGAPSSLDSTDLNRPLHSRRQMLSLGGMAALTTLLGSAAQVRAEVPVPEHTDLPFQIVIVIFSKGTMLDFAGPNEVFQHMKNTKVRFASAEGGAVTVENGIVFGATEKLADIKHADLLFVPGGADLTDPMRPEVLSQIRRLADGAKYVTSVCTGSLILGAAGVLKGKRSACHWACLNLLKDYGAIPDPARYVRDGRFMSGGGVTSGIDFALHVAAEIRGPLEAQSIQLMIEYDPQPAFQSGHPRVASREVLELVEKQMPGSTQGLFQLIR